MPHCGGGTRLGRRLQFEPFAVQIVPGRNSRYLIEITGVAGIRKVLYRTLVIANISGTDLQNESSERTSLIVAPYVPGKIEVSDKRFLYEMPYL